MRGVGQAATTAARALREGLRGSWVVVLLVAGTAAGLLIALRKGSFGGARRGERGSQGSVRFYRDLLRVLARKGFVKHTGMTPREFGATVEAGGRPELAGVSDTIDLYYGVRYGGRQLSDSERQQIARTIRRLADARVAPSALSAQMTALASAPQTPDPR